MFRGTVDRTSHEGGLLLTFSGSSPALGSIIVREEDGHYIGKVDAVLGSTEAPLAHVAHLDRKQDNDAFIGATVTIRAKKEREERPRREQRSERPQRRDDRSLTVEIIVEGMTIKKTTGFVPHATMSISLGERNATVVEKARMGTSKLQIFFQRQQPLKQSSRPTSTGTSWTQRLGMPFMWQH